MTSLRALSKEKLTDLQSALWNEYRQEQAKGLHLNMSRGKPAPDQLDLSMDLLRLPDSCILEDGTDARNYGILQGIPECRKLFGNLLGIPADQIIMGGNASLNLMFDTMAFLFLFGTGGNRPWADYRTVGRTVRIFMPGSRLRPPLPDLRRTRHRNDPCPSSGRRPGYEPGERTGQKRRADQGHLVCPAALQPAGCHATAMLW